MLGKLFNLGAGSATGSPPAPTGSHKLISSLESVQEDLHTRNLLFPDPQDLYEHRLNHVFPLSNAASVAASSTNAFDYNGDIELDGDSDSDSHSGSDNDRGARLPSPPEWANAAPGSVHFECDRHRQILLAEIERLRAMVADLTTRNQELTRENQALEERLGRRGKHTVRVGRSPICGW